MNDLNGEREQLRLRDLHDYAILDTPPEESFDRITELAKTMLRTPMAVVSLVAENRQWFKSKIGVAACQTPRDISFCNHTIQHDEPLIVRNALKDPRFASSPLVTGEPNIRFYIGTPLHTPGGYNIGALCAMDTVPRDPTPEQVKLLQDLGRLVIDELELRKLAYLDPLTGTWTKRGLEGAIKNLRKGRGGGACVVMMDVDHFKRVNDTHGHDAGDRVLKALAQACRASLRPADIIARVGGEEFAMILPGVALPEGLIAAEKMRAAIAGQTVATREGAISVTASFGVATAAGDMAEFQNALAAADSAMYAAKACGRNAVRAAGFSGQRGKVA
ncbi:MAG: sensor domain-containing diguanylate cyclase [Rhizobiales bacterium]|nr:sensor domain-containing diguanylate cyclase [Hyphomicrobiales bacterium]